MNYRMGNKLILALLLILFLSGCASTAQKEEAFSALVNTRLNKEIILQRSSTNSPGLIGFSVLNYATESVNFSDQGFGVTIYYYDESVLRWEKKELSPYPEPSPKTLLAKTTDFSHENISRILEDDIVNVVPGEYRLYIEGVGDVTREKYGAFFDFVVRE